MTRIRVAVGVTVYNEEQNLSALLGAVSAASGPHLDLVQILVVSSGSTDRTVPIAEAWAKRDPRIEVTVDEVRRGKATAVNQFLSRIRPDVAVCILAGGDLLPSPSALDALVAPFASPEVGMTGAHPVPTNRHASVVDRIVHLQWELHDELARVHPKMGEVVAFRSDVPRLDPKTVVDEAWLETVAKARAQALVYVPEAVVYNRGPTSLRELVDQRRRIYCGHLLLRRSRQYEVSTFRGSSLLRVASQHLKAKPKDALTTVLAAGVEACGRVLGTLDYFKGKEPYVWRQVTTSKSAVEAPSDGPRR